MIMVSVPWLRTLELGKQLKLTVYESLFLEKEILKNNHHCLGLWY